MYPLYVLDVIMENDTPSHPFYICPCNQHCENDDAQNTKDLVALAEAQAESYQCMWFRGILLSRCIQIDSEYGPADHLDIVCHKGEMRWDL